MLRFVVESLYAARLFGFAPAKESGPGSLPVGHVALRRQEIPAQKCRKSRELIVNFQILR